MYETSFHLDWEVAIAVSSCIDLKMSPDFKLFSQKLLCFFTFLLLHWTHTVRSGLRDRLSSVLLSKGNWQKTTTRKSPPCLFVYWENLASLRCLSALSLCLSEPTRYAYPWRLPLQPANPHYFHAIFEINNVEELCASENSSDHIIMKRANQPAGKETD